MATGIGSLKTVLNLKNTPRSKIYGLGLEKAWLQPQTPLALPAVKWAN